MKAIEIVGQLNRDASMVSRLCASYTIWRRELSPTILREKRWKY
jgi:hypothetical protein